MSELYDSSNLLQGDRLPGISFVNGVEPRIFLCCPDIHVLVGSFELLRHKNWLASYSMRLVATGYPFLHQFWRFEVSLADPDRQQFIADVKTYIDTNEDQLGKTHGAWAKFYTVSGFQDKKVFSGSLILLTEKGALTDPSAAPAFRDAKPALRSHADKN